MASLLFRRVAAFLPGLALVALSQEARIGEPPPPLSIEQIAGGGSTPTWDSLRGRPVIVEFWATWCGPCLSEIPHLNALASRFPGVQFLAITDEPPAVVEPFLEKQPISGIVGIDRNRSTFTAFGVEGIPRAFLVDERGFLRGAYHPRQLTEAVITDFVAGRPISVRHLSSPSRFFKGTDAEPLFATGIRPSTKDRVGGILRVDPGMLEGQNLPLRTIVAHAYALPSMTEGTRLEGPGDILSTRYDFCVLLPRGMEGDLSLLREMLGRAIHLNLRREKRTVDAFVLMAGNAKLMSSDEGYTMSHLAGTLEYRLKRFVVDETGLVGHYRFDYPRRNEDLEPFVRDHLGLAFESARREVEIVFIDSIELPAYR